MVSTEPFWLFDYPRPRQLPVSPLPGRCDVAVVGAGLTGLSCARSLAASGADVVVIDADHIGSGASAVNGGMVNHGLQATTRTVFDRYGPELGRELWNASLESVDMVERIVAEEGIDCSFARNGAAELGFTSRDRRRFADEAGWLAEHVGFQVDVVDGEGLRDVIDSRSFSSALVDSIGAGLHPARYVFGLATAVARRGGLLVEHAKVHSISRHVGGYQLLTAAGKLTAGSVVLATNGYTTAQPVRALRRRVVTVGSYAVVTEPLPAGLAERLIPGNRVLWTSRRFLNYFRRTPDDRMLMGGRHSLATDLDLDVSAAVLGKTIARFFPELAELQVTHSWTGKLGVTFDLIPHIGSIDGVWYALGYGGHGIGLGTHLGAEVAKLITGEIDRSPFADIPHPTRFYYRERPWFLPVATSWYRLLDSIGR